MKRSLPPSIAATRALWIFSCPAISGLRREGAANGAAMRGVRIVRKSSRLPQRTDLLSDAKTAKPRMAYEALMRCAFRGSAAVLPSRVGKRHSHQNWPCPESGVKRNWILHQLSSREPATIRRFEAGRQGTHHLGRRPLFSNSQVILRFFSPETAVFSVRHCIDRGIQSEWFHFTIGLLHPGIRRVYSHDHSPTIVSVEDREGIFANGTRKPRVHLVWPLLDFEDACPKVLKPGFFLSLSFVFAAESLPVHTFRVYNFGRCRPRELPHEVGVKFHAEVIASEFCWDWVVAPAVGQRARTHL